MPFEELLRQRRIHRRREAPSGRLTSSPLGSGLREQGEMVIPGTVTSDCSSYVISSPSSRLCLAHTVYHHLAMLRMLAHAAVRRRRDEATQDRVSEADEVGSSGRICENGQMVADGGGPDPGALQGHPERAKVFHEAGHAVVCVLEGKRLRIVSATGDVRIPEPEEVSTKDFWGVRVALAGFAADYISSRDSDPLTLERLATGPGQPGAEHDFKHACRLAAQAMGPCSPPDSIRDCLVEQLEAVKHTLQRCWRTVEVVAEHLAATGQLSGEQVAEFVGRANG